MGEWASEIGKGGEHSKSRGVSCKLLCKNGLGKSLFSTLYTLFGTGSVAVPKSRDSTQLEVDADSGGTERRLLRSPKRVIMLNRL